MWPTFVALAEPNRLRIVELLREAPRPVGEIAAALDLRQPQVTKHLQALERAGLVTVHPLGRRRVCALRREALVAVREWAAGFGGDDGSERALLEYRAAIAAEERTPGTTRTLRIQRDLLAPPEAVWAAWTTARLVRRWWAPQHFEVADATVRAVPGGRLRIVMGEGDGTRHTATGRFLAVEAPHRLEFTLAPVDLEGRELFSAHHTLELEPLRAGTRARLTIHVEGAAPELAPLLAGMRPGWDQMLDKLAREAGSLPRPQPR